MDEWIKAVHYDPNRHGDGEGGYWFYPDSSDAPLAPGPPGEGESSAGYQTADPDEPWRIPLGAYPGTQTPWGLLDASGGASEWMEDYLVGSEGYFRWYDGASAGRPASAVLDDIREAGASYPISGGSWIGLRVATLIPSPSALIGALTFAYSRGEPDPRII